MLDSSKLPGMFTFYVALFILLGISQSISGIYNVFFAGNDLVAYLPLPFRNHEIFISKLLVVVLNTIPFTTPLLLIFALTAIRAHVFIVSALLLTIVVYLLILSLILMLCSLLVFGLTKLKLFQQHQKVVMNLMLALNLVLILGGLFFLNHGSNNPNQLDHAVLTPLFPIFKIFTMPTSATSLLALGTLVGLSLVLALLTRQYVLAHLVEQLTVVNTALTSTPAHVTRQHHKRHGLKQMLNGYQLQVLKEPNLVFQLFSTSILMPIILIFPWLFSGSASNFSQLSLNWLGVWFIVGIFLAVITVNQTTLVANIISLDKMNFEFIKALPISTSQYLWQKFYWGYGLQAAITAIIALIVALVTRLPLLLSIALIVGVAWGTYLMSQHYFIRDYHLRSTNWTNVTQLFNRGSGNIGLVLGTMAGAIAGAIIIGIYSWLISSVSSLALLINLVVFAIIIIISGGLLWYYRQSFWHRIVQ